MRYISKSETFGLCGSSCIENYNGLSFWKCCLLACLCWAHLLAEIDCKSLVRSFEPIRLFLWSSAPMPFHLAKWNLVRFKKWRTKWARPTHSHRIECIPIWMGGSLCGLPCGLELGAYIIGRRQRKMKRINEWWIEVLIFGCLIRNPLSRGVNALYSKNVHSNEILISIYYVHLHRRLVVCVQWIKKTKTKKCVPRKN